MKKLALLMTLVMVMALAIPAHAAEVSVSGKVAVNTTYGKDAAGEYAFTGKGDVNADFKVNVGSGTTAEIGWNLGLDELALGSGPFTGETRADLDHAWIETTGALFKNGPEATTRLGRFETNFSDWIADFGTLDNIRVTGLEMGPVTLGLAHGWPNSTDRVGAVSVSGALDVVDLSAVVVSDKAVTRESLDYIVEAGVEPADGVSTGVTYAARGKEQKTAVKVTGELSTIPDLTLSAEYFSVQDGFAVEDPARWSNEDDGKTTAYTEDEVGFKVSAETVQAGLPLEASFTSKKRDSDPNATQTVISLGTTIAEVEATVTLTNPEGDWDKEPATADQDKTELVLKRAFGEIEGKYTLTREGEATSHKVEASTTVDTPIADDVKLSGAVTLPEGGDAEIKAEASWKAPNGIDLAVKWANYNDNGDVNGANADGLYLTAGITVEF